ncbi:hypothetical protein MAR_015313 [Mya arenaria]|uniref:Caspase recruitment domain-containing protein n=1 Tax=Mya arenaria TaxID=6604 RepID=A0ABY7FJK1_MYAAR|nr:hypothetical protein MAR_015313 [Mya arenaria]
MSETDLTNRRGFEYMKSLLEDDNVDSDEDRVRGRKLIRLFGPELEKNINPIEILSTLVSKRAITEGDRDEVLNLCHTKNRLHGMMCLLHKMQSKLRPKEWYYAFLCALRDNDYQSECDRLEPDFLTHPNVFDPKYLSFLAMSASIYPNEELLELRLQFWRKEIVRCLDSPTIVSQLAAKDVFDEELSFLAMSASIYPNEELLELRLQFWRKEIVRCLDSPTIVSQLAAKDVFDEGFEYMKSLLEDDNVDSDEDRVRGEKSTDWIKEENIGLVYVKSLLEDDNVDSAEDRVRDCGLSETTPQYEESLKGIHEANHPSSSSTDNFATLNREDQDPVKKMMLYSRMRMILILIQNTKKIFRIQTFV